MSADTPSIHRKPSLDRTGLVWLGATTLAMAVWFAVYGQLKPFSEWAVARLPLAPGSRAASPSATCSISSSSEKASSMKNVKVLGPGCKRCEAAEEMVRKEAAKQGLAVQIEKVSDYAAIAGYGILSTPGIVIDGKVVHAGGLPKPDDLAKWLAA
jgi:small redox-active disulfide protein 2